MEKYFNGMLRNYFLNIAIRKQCANKYELYKFILSYENSTFKITNGNEIYLIYKRKSIYYIQIHMPDYTHYEEISEKEIDESGIIWQVIN